MNTSHCYSLAGADGFDRPGIFYPAFTVFAECPFCPFFADPKWDESHPALDGLADWRNVDDSMQMNKLLILAGCVAGVVVSAATGALATDPESKYYRTLEKPAWQPPPPVYGIVWTPLYADIALSSGHAISELGQQGRTGERKGLIIALIANLALNTTWSGLFFRNHRPWLAAAECAVLTVSSVDLVRRVGAADRRAGFALAPYPAWCAFATALTVAVARLNPRSAIVARGE